MEEIKKKSTRGGARPGAGRKPMGYVRSFTFKALPDVEQILQTLPEGWTLNAFLNEAVRQCASMLKKRV